MVCVWFGFLLWVPFSQVDSLLRNGFTKFGFRNWFRLAKASAFCSSRRKLKNLGPHFPSKMTFEKWFGRFWFWGFGSHVWAHRRACVRAPDVMRGCVRIMVGAGACSPCAYAQKRSVAFCLRTEPPTPALERPFLAACLVPASRPCRQGISEPFSGV